MTIIQRSALAALAFAFATSLVALPTYANDTLTLKEAWTRATPPGATNGGGFLTITNTGAEADRLTGGSVSGVGKVEIHTMVMDGDVMKMRPLPDGLEVPAGETVTLKPGGDHVMFMQLENPFEEGQMLDVTLTFEKAGDMSTMFMVQPVGASEPKHMHGHN